MGNKSYHPFSVTVASLAASAVLSRVMALGTSAMVSWAMASVTSVPGSSGKALEMWALGDVGVVVGWSLACRG